jgi:hypothetical protein
MGAGMALTREDILDAVRQLQEDDDLLLEAARALLDERVLRKLATRAPDVFDTLRRFILTEELLQLPAEFREFRQQVNERFDRLEGDLAGFKQETRERFDRLEGDLAGFKQETRERFDRVETVQNQLLEDVRDLRNWKEGEKARRDGLDYQRRVIKRAWRTFGGGEGGWPDENPEVAYQIDQWLADAGIDGNTLAPRSDPQDADLVWWKGRKVAVVEIFAQGERRRCGAGAPARGHAPTSRAGRHPLRHRRGVGAPRNTRQRAETGRRVAHRQRGLRRTARVPRLLPVAQQVQFACYAHD